MKDDDIINSMIDYGDDKKEAVPSGDTQKIPTQHTNADTENEDDNSARENIDYTQVIDTKQVLEIFEQSRQEPKSSPTPQPKTDFEPEKTQKINSEKDETKDKQTDGVTRIINLSENSDTECFSGDEGEDEPDNAVLKASQKQQANIQDELTPAQPKKITQNFKYDEYSNYDDYEKSPVVPMIKSTLKIAVPVLAVVAVVLVVLTSQSAFMTRYRNNFSENTGKLLDNMGINIHKQQPIQTGEPQNDNAQENIQDDTAEQNAVSENAANSEVSGEEVELKARESEYKTFVHSSVTIPFTGTEDASFVKYSNGIIGAKTNYICCISDKGEKQWEKIMILTDPIVKAEGEYILAYQENGKKFVLFKGEEEIYNKNSDDNILNANVSANGDVVLVTDKPAYKGAVAVYNKKGNKAFSWSSGSADILAADISDNSRRVAATLLHTEDRVSSSVYMFDINKTEPYVKTEFANSVVYGLDFKGNRLTAFSDNMITGMNDGGKVKFNIDFDGAELITCSMDDNGNHAALFTQDNIPMINVYNKNGNLSSTIPVLRMPDYMASEHGNVIYNVDRDIILGKPDAKKPYKYTAAMDIRGLIPINNSSFMIIYSNSVEFVRMGGGLF